MLTNDFMHSLSPTYEKLMKTKKGYRSEEYSGSVVRNLSDVIEFEIGELWNEDILDFVNKHYTYNNKVYSSTEVIMTISNMLELDPDELYCIWLTTRDNCKSKYGDDIYEYVIDDSYLIPISDLDNDGVLFVTSRYPGGQLEEKRRKRV